MFRTVIITTRALTQKQIQQTQTRFNPDFTCIVGPTQPVIDGMQNVRYDRISLPTSSLGLPIEHLEAQVYAIARQSGYFLEGDKVLITEEVDKTIQSGLFALACKCKAYPVRYGPENVEDAFPLATDVQLAYKIFLGSRS